MAPKPPSQRQLNYLRALANRTGQTFTMPRTSTDASRQISRLLEARPSTALERAIETEDPARIEAAQDMREIVGLEFVDTRSARS